MQPPGFTGQLQYGAGAALDATDEEGETALMNAAYCGEADAAAALLKAGADRAAKATAGAYKGKTALEIATENGNEAVAAVFAAAGDRAAEAWLTKKALRAAAKGGDGAAIEAALRGGADVDAKTAAGLTPLDLLDQEIAKKKSTEVDRKASGPRHDREVGHYERIVKRRNFLSEVFDGVRKRRRLQAEAAAEGGTHLHADPKEEL